jgi:signal transduction histidine kinase
LLSERELVRAVEALLSRMPMTVELRAAPKERLPAPVEVAFYYLIAESLTNACKHAHANTVSVEIGRADGRAWVQVTDDGVGGAKASEGSGLCELGDRVEALDGTLTVLSLPGDGTTICAEVACA